MRKSKEQINLELESLDIKLLQEDSSHVYYRWYNYVHNIVCIMCIKIEDDQFGICCYDRDTKIGVVLNNNIIELLQQIGYWKVRESQGRQGKNLWKFYIENTELNITDKTEYIDALKKK